MKLYQKLILSHLLVAVIAFLFAYSNSKNLEKNVTTERLKNKIDSLRVVNDSLFNRTDSIIVKTIKVTDTLTVIKNKYIQMRNNYEERIETDPFTADTVVVCSVNLRTDFCQRFFSSLSD